MIRFFYLLTFIFPLLSFARESDVKKYFIQFKDKEEPASFEALSYFHENALHRRKIHGLESFDQLDLPVNPNYVSKISALADSVSVVSRWLNGMVLYSSDQDFLDKVSAFSFVKATYLKNPYDTKKRIAKAYGMKKTVEHLQVSQTRAMGLKYLQDNKIDGKGVRVAVFDAGFPEVDKVDVFEHLLKSNRIEETYDFVRKKEDVFGKNSHGTSVLSCIAGISDDEPIGLATGATFILARTEQSMEPLSEEENWLAAAEWADKHGADMISSSLGYTNDRYYRRDMTGSVSLVAEAARIATRKGILVLNANGNEFGDDWKVLITPADVDSVLSVGGIDPKTLLRISFSSVGPNMKLQPKPEIAAYGRVYACTGEKLNTITGTSFATPLVAGFAACAKQMFPDLTVMELKKKVIESGVLYPYFDYSHGSGIPHAYFLFNERESEADTTFEISESEAFLKVTVKDKYLLNTTPLFSKLNTHSQYGSAPPYLFYKVTLNSGFIEQYGVIEVYKKDVLDLVIEDLNGGKISLYYKGYFYEKEF